MSLWRKGCYRGEWAGFSGWSRQALGSMSITQFLISLSPEVTLARIVDGPTEFEQTSAWLPGPRMIPYHQRDFCHLLQLGHWAVPWEQT